MRAQTIRQKKSSADEVDRRSLINLDLYNHEITIMQGRLNEVITNSIEETEKLEHLIYQLNYKKQYLQNFSDKYRGDEIIGVEREKSEPKRLKKKDETDEIKREENFYQHLQLFENTFKNIR